MQIIRAALQEFANKNVAFIPGIIEFYRQFSVCSSIRFHSNRVALRKFVEIFHPFCENKYRENKLSERQVVYKKNT